MAALVILEVLLPTGSLPGPVEMWRNTRRRIARTRRYSTIVRIRMFHQVLLTVIGAAAGVMATLLLGSGGGPRISAGIELFPLLAYGLLIVAVVLVLRVLVVIFRRD